MFAVDSTVPGLVAAGNVIVAGVLGLLYAMDRRRRSGDVHFNRTVKGFEDLLDAQEKRMAAQDRRIVDLEARLDEQQVEVKLARQESFRANAHAGECEAEL